MGALAIGLLMGCASSPQEEDPASISPTKLNVESFIDTIDITQDIS